MSPESVDYMDLLTKAQDIELRLQQASINRDISKTKLATIQHTDASLLSELEQLYEQRNELEHIQRQASRQLRYKKQHNRRKKPIDMSSDIHDESIDYSPAACDARDATISQLRHTISEKEHQKQNLMLTSYVYATKDVSSADATYTELCSELQLIYQEMTVTILCHPRIIALITSPDTDDDYIKLSASSAVRDVSTDDTTISGFLAEYDSSGCGPTAGGIAGHCPATIADSADDDEDMVGVYPSTIISRTPELSAEWQESCGKYLPPNEECGCHQPAKSKQICELEQQLQDAQIRNEGLTTTNLRLITEATEKDALIALYEAIKRQLYQKIEEQRMEYNQLYERFNEHLLTCSNAKLVDEYKILKQKTQLLCELCNDT
jgi:hypothetical protein